MTNTQSIHIEYYGAGLPLVFFHGWGFNCHVWYPLIDDLVQDYQVILVDLPGFGKTSMMDWDVFKSLLLKNIPKSSVVIGWSLGGLYATRLAYEAQEYVSALFNVTTAPKFIEDESWPGVPKNIFLGFYNTLLLDKEKALTDFIQLQLNKVSELFDLNFIPSLAGLQNGLSVLDTWDLRDILAKIKQPTCYLFGRLDPIVPFRIMQLMETMYPNIECILFTRAAHMPFLSHRLEFIKELRGFIHRKVSGK